METASEILQKQVTLPDTSIYVSKQQAINAMLEYGAKLAIEKLTKVKEYHERCAEKYRSAGWDINGSTYSAINVHLRSRDEIKLMIKNLID